MLKKYEAALNFTCVELRTLDQHEDFPEALADPEGLVWQVNYKKYKFFLISLFLPACILFPLKRTLFKHVMFLGLDCSR